MAPSRPVNIGPVQRRRRRDLGLAALAVAILITITGWATGLLAVARFAAALLFLGGFNGVFQARAKT